MLRVSKLKHWLVFVLLVLFFASTRSFGIEKRILPYHILKITVSGHPEFSETVEVKRDGTTEYPLMAGIPIDGLTADDVKELLRSILLRFEMEPDIFVVVSDVEFLKFQIFGQVGKPGNFEMEGPINIQQAVSLSGGILDDGDESHIRILRIENNQRVEHEINLFNYFQQDSLLIPPEIHDADIIIIPKKDNKLSVRITGVVGSPGLYIVQPGDNILDVIERAGGNPAVSGSFYGSSGYGFTGGDMRRVIYITHVDNIQKRMIVDINRYVQRGNYNSIPKVIPGDLIIIPQQNEWRDPWFIINRLTTLMSFTLGIMAFSRVF